MFEFLKRRPPTPDAYDAALKRALLFLEGAYPFVKASGVLESEKGEWVASE